MRNHVTKNSQRRASSLVAHTTETHSFVAKRGQQSFLEKKCIIFFEFDLKLPVRIVAKPYLQDYTNPKYKSSNTNSIDTCKHVMKFVKTLGVDGLDDDLKLKEFSKSLIEKAYTWYVNLTPGFVESWGKCEGCLGRNFFLPKRRERVLDIHDAHYENELVKVCI
ncbi:hypothetical protein Goshw_009465 [Gossypium schwendimanii]|uniref:Retrotransposon gag domain-containing protein n=1 Tax=Gossypium schwendimanii TaxID=34291 RepID=A0A7J9NBC5_GOSSC|nr:hypothetical protein [Gossypium schwendimanii]